MDHNYFMKQALIEAQKAYDNKEVPIGAVVVSEGKIIGRGYNMVEKLNDATAHAEMIALTAAMNYMGSKYISNSSIYITVEPCAMCAGAIAWAQCSEIVFGAHEPKHGFTRLQPPIQHSKTNVVSGILAHDCSILIKQFFLDLRQN
jgi:tRNA(adenine34) deaminase